MKRLFLLYKRNIIISSIIIVLFAWAVSATLLGLSKKDKVILIRISNDGTSIIDALNSEEELSQEKAFLRRFISLMYNYDFISFEDNINRVSHVLSDEFWLKVEKEMKDTKPTIIEKKISQTAAIEKIVRLSPGEYELTTQSTIVKSGEAQDNKLKIKVLINKVSRTIQNPWGMEVGNATEERIM